MDIAIRVDAGPDIGYGHFIRMNALAYAFLENSHTVTILTTTPNKVAQQVNESITIKPLRLVNTNKEITNFLTTLEPDAICIDTYDVGTSFFKEVSDSDATIIAQVDDDDRQLLCDIVVNGHIYADSLEYDYIGEKPTFCLGLNYLLLQPIFSSLANTDPEFNKTPKRAVILMGGSDTQNMMPLVIRSFSGLNLEVDVILGPGFQNKSDIDEAIKETDADFNLVADSLNLAEKMVEADLAVSAMGMTTYELLAAGTPTIGIPQADDPRQLLLGDGLSAASAVEVLEPYPSMNRISDSITKLCVETTRRRELQMQGHNLISHGGVGAVYDVIMKEID